MDREITFNVNQLRKCINITIIQDNIEEGDTPENVRVQLVPRDGDIVVDFTVLDISILDSNSKIESGESCKRL